jgi:hypothetical protein
MKRHLAMLFLVASLVTPPFAADSCKTSNEKLQRDSKELEETEHKLEAERGCEKQPPYACPKEP